MARHEEAAKKWLALRKPGMVQRCRQDANPVLKNA